MTPTRWLLVALSFAAAIGVSLWIVFTSWPHGRAAVSLPLGAHALLAATVFADLMLRALKIRLAGSAVGIHVSLGIAYRTGLAGDFAAAITPARTGAEPARFLVLAEAGIPAAGTLILMFAELFLEMLGLVITAMILALVFHDAGASLGWIVGLIGGYSMFVLGVGLVGALLALRKASGPPPGWARMLGMNALRWRAVQRALRKLRSSVTSLREANLGLLALATLVSVLHILMRLAALPIIVYGLGAGEVPLAPLLLWPLALYYGGVVAPVPGGGGFIEAAFKWSLGGVIPAASFAASLVWWRVYTFYLYLGLGAIAAGRTVMRALNANGGARGRRHAAHADALAQAEHAEVGGTGS